MQAAEGEVQEKGYVASFPSLINAAGEATYIMVLKDNGGLVKLYALVNVEQYSIVATGSTQTEAMAAYKALLLENGIVEEEKEPENKNDKKLKENGGDFGGELGFDDEEFETIRAKAHLLDGFRL